MMRKRRGRRRAAATWVPILTVAAPNDRWSVNFVHDKRGDARGLRILNVIDDVTKECRPTHCNGRSPPRSGNAPPIVH